MAMEKSKQLQD